MEKGGKTMSLTKADLAAITQIVNHGVADLKADVAELKTDVAELKAEMKEVKADVAKLKIDVAKLKTEMKEVKTDIAELKTDVGQLKEEVADLKVDVAAFSEELRRMRLCVETEVKPQLRLITDCYIATFERYRKESERLPRAYHDIDMMKLTLKKQQRLLDYHEKILKTRN